MQPTRQINRNVNEKVVIAMRNLFKPEIFELQLSHRRIEGLNEYNFHSQLDRDVVPQK